MAYCPKCLTQYEESARECMDCHVALRPGSPPPAASTPDEIRASHDVKLVTIRVFSGNTAPPDAEMAKNLLESEGIPCILSGANAAWLYHVFEVPLMVREEDAEEASRILKEYLDSGPAPLDESPA